MAEQIAPPTDAELKAAVAEPSQHELVAATLPARLAKWAPQITNAAQTTTPQGVEIGQWASAISAVIGRETEGRNVAIHADGHGHGLMGIDDRYHEFARGPDVLDPDKNVAYGASVLKDLFEKLPPEMDFDEKLIRAAASYNGGPKHLRAEEPDAGTAGNDYGTDVLGRTKSVDLSFLAHQTANGPTQAEAAKNFGTAEASGLPVNVVALDHKAAQAQADQKSIKVALAGAPVLTDFAAQSKQHAAVVREEAPKLSWLERWFTGSTRLMPVDQRAVGPYAEYQRTHGGAPETDTPPVVVTAFARAMINLRSEWEGFNEFLMKRMSDPEILGRIRGMPSDHPDTVGDAKAYGKQAEEQAKTTQKWKDLSESPETSLEASSAKLPQHAIHMGVGLVPYLVSGPAAPAVLAAQTIGHLTADGVSPDVAATGGVIAGLSGTLGAELITKGLGTVAEAAGVSKLLASTVPKLWKAGEPYVEQFSRSAINGWLMTAMTSATERVSSVFDKASKEGRTADPSEYAQAAAQSLSDANAALPFLGLLGAAHATGRWVEAHGNAMAHDAMTAPLRDTQVPTEQLRDLLREQIRSSAVEKNRFVDPEVFDKVMLANGEDPTVMAEKLGSGASYKFAKDTGGLFAVPTENYLVDLLEYHEDLREGVASDPQGATLSRDGGESLVAAHSEEQAPPAAGAQTPHAPHNEPPTYGTAFAKRLYVDMQVRSKSINELEALKGTYKGAATRAQKGIDKLSTKTVDLLSSAEQSAQQGVDEALEAARSGRGAAVSVKTSDLTSLRRLNNQIRKIITQGRMAGVDPTAIPDDVASYVNAAVKEAATKAVKGAKITPADVKSIISQQLKQANTEFQSSLAGSRRAEEKSNKATEKTVEAGDAAAETAVLKQQRDLNAAMHESKEIALKRGHAVLGKIKDQTGNDVRERLYNNKASGHPEYGWGYDLVMEALGLRLPDASYRPQDFQEVVDHLRDNGENVQFDVDAIRELVARPKEPGDLTVDELANVHNALKNITHLASERSKNYIDGKMEERSNIINNDIAPKAAALGRVPHAPGRRVLGKVSKFFGIDMDQLDAAYSDFHTLLAQAGDWGFGQEARFIQVRFNENQLLSRWAKIFEEMPKELKLLGTESVQHPAWLPQEARDLYGDALSRRDLWNLILRSGTVEGMDGLSRGWKAAPAQITGWLHSVVNTKAEWDFIQNWWKNAEEMGDMEQALDSNRSGLPMVRKTPRQIVTPHDYQTITGGYAPERWFHRQALPAKTENDPTKSVRAMTDTEHGFLKALDPNVALVPDPFFDHLPMHVRGLAKDLSMGDFVRDQARMLNDPMFQKAVEPLGDWYYKALINWHNRVQSGQMSQSIDALVTHGAVTTARGYAARAIFNLNFKVAGNLMGHLPFAKAVEGGDINLAQGIANGIFSPEARAYAMQNSMVLRNRSERWMDQLREQERQLLGEGHRMPGTEVFRAPSQAMWHMADTNLGQVIFNGLKHTAESRGMRPQEADRYADIHLDRLMPSMDVYGKPAIANNSWIGMYVLARNFESTVWNAKARVEIQQRLNIASGAQQGWSRYYGQMLGVAASLGVSYYVFGGHGRNEQEQKNGWLGWGQMVGRTMIEHYTYGGYLLHLAAQNFAGALVGEGWPDPKQMRLFDTPEHTLLQQYTNDLGQVTKAALHNGAPSKALLAGLDAGARLFGLGQPLKSAVGAERVLKYRIFDQNDFKSTPRTYVGDAGKIWYGDVDKYDSNVFSDADKGLATTFDGLWRK